MADLEKPRFTSEQQRNFAASTFVDAGSVVTDIKGTIYDTQPGEPEPKATLAKNTIGAVAAQVTLGLVLALLGKNNKMLNNLFLNGWVFISAIVFIAACGFALLLHKHWRSQTLTAGILFGLFSLGIGLLIAGLMANWEYYHFFMVLLLSATIAVDFMWFSLWRNKLESTIQRSFVVATFLSLLVVVVMIIIIE